MIAHSSIPRPLNAGRFSLAIEPGHEEMWFAMRDHLRGPFSAEDVAQVVGGKVSLAARYVRHLVQLGVAQEVGLSTDRKVLFSARRLGSIPEVFDAKGDVSTDYHLRLFLWQATRRLKHCVTEAKLLDMVGADIAVTSRQVKNWISRLVAADYLTEMYGKLSKPKTGDTEYQLRPLRDTGPLPPRFCESTLIYDVNLAIRGSKAEAFFGVGQAREVRL